MLLRGELQPAKRASGPASADHRDHRPSRDAVVLGTWQPDNPDGDHIRRKDAK